MTDDGQLNNLLSYMTTCDSQPFPKKGILLVVSLMYVADIGDDEMKYK